MGWLTDKFKAAKDWTQDRVDHAWNNTVSGLESAKETVTASIGTVTDTVSYVISNPGEAFNNAKDATWNAGRDTIYSARDGIVAGGEWLIEGTVHNANYLWENKGDLAQKAFDETWNFSVYFAQNPHRALAMQAQGLANGVTGLVGSTVDAATTIAYNWNPQRHIINGLHNFVGLEPPLEECTWSCRDTLQGKVDFFQPRNGYEQTILITNSLTTEIGGSIAIIVATGGAAAPTAIKTVGTTYKVLEGVDAAGLIIETPAEREKRIAQEANAIENQLLEEVLATIEDDFALLSDAVTVLGDKIEIERLSVEAQMSAGTGDYDALLTRWEELKATHESAVAISENEEINSADKLTLLKNLDNKTFGVEQENTRSASYTRPDGAGEKSKEFAHAASGETAEVTTELKNGDPKREFTAPGLGG